MMQTLRKLSWLAQVWSAFLERRLAMADTLQMYKAPAALYHPSGNTGLFNAIYALINIIETKWWVVQGSNL